MAERVDWRKAVELTQDSPGTWVLIGTNIRLSILRTAERAPNRFIRELEFELMMPDVVGNPPRGDLYMKYYGDRVRRRGAVGETYFRIVNVNEDLRSLIDQYVEENEMTISALVTEALGHIVEYGYQAPPRNTSSQLNVRVRATAWDAAKDRAAEDGFSLAHAIRDEVGKIVRGHVVRARRSADGKLKKEGRL